MPTLHCTECKLHYNPSYHPSYNPSKKDVLTILFTILLTILFTLYIWPYYSLRVVQEKAYFENNIATAFVIHGLRTKKRTLRVMSANVNLDTPDFFDKKDGGFSSCAVLTQVRFLDILYPPIFIFSCLIFFSRIQLF